MDRYYVIIGLSYFVIGLAVAIVFFYVLKRPILGGFWGGLAVALVGSFLGGMLDFLVFEIEFLDLAGIVDVVPPLLTSVALVWLFSRISRRAPD